MLAYSIRMNMNQDYDDDEWRKEERREEIVLEILGWTVIAFGIGVFGVIMYYIANG